jgi:outer membrane protease
LSGYDYTGTGEVGLTYEVRYSIPYTEIGAQFKIKDFSVETTLGYSPLVNAKDEDHHILRSKVNKGDCDGDAIFFSLKGQYDFLKNWFLTLGFEYMKIETEGESDAYFYGVYDHTIDEEIFSEQKVIAFTVGYVF